MKTELLRAEEELENLERRRTAVGGIRARIRMLETDAVGIGSYDTSRLRVNEQRARGRKDTLDERAWLREREKALTEWIQHVERVLKEMHPREATVLKVIYCSNLRRDEAVRRLEKELNVGRSEVYRLRERALEELAARLGFIE